MTQIKYIKNPPTIEELEQLYSSSTYQRLLEDFEKITKQNFYQGLDEKTTLWNLLAYAQRRYLTLNLPFEQVSLEFERLQEQLLRFTIASYDFFNKEPDNNPDGEFPDGEELGEENKSQVIKSLGMSKTIFLDKFCEFYLLQTENKEMLANFLKLTRMPYAKKYQGQLNKIYKQLLKR